MRGQHGIGGQKRELPQLPGSQCIQGVRIQHGGFPLGIRRQKGVQDTCRTGAKPRPSQQDRRLFRKALAHGGGICGQNPAVRVGAAGQGTAFRRAGQHQLDHRLHAGKVHQPGPGAQRTLHTKGGSPPVSKATRCGSHTAVTALVALRPALRQQGGDLVLIQLMHQRFPPLRFGVKDV